jgi:hypothetical protein
MVTIRKIWFSRRFKRDLGVTVRGVGVMAGFTALMVWTAIKLESTDKTIKGVVGKK